jgi:D-arginine dehydrogenase
LFWLPTQVARLYTDRRFRDALDKEFAGVRSIRIHLGYDPRQSGFFWMAALGGYGIQTAPTLSRLAASLALGKRIDDDLQAQGITASAFSPDRITVETTI